MRKYLVKFGVLGILIFLGFFVYYYKTSGKFRQSVLAAFVAVTVSLSSLQPAQAGEADAFTPQQQHLSRSQNPQGIFGRKSSSYSGSEPGKPNNGSGGDDANVPKYTKPESVEETQRHLSNIDEQINKLEEVTDSDSETEENQCELDENVKDGKIEIVYRIKENPALVREAERMGKDQAAQKDVNNLIEQLSLGNDNPGIGNRRVKGLKNVSEARGRNEGRVYFREKNGKIEILAKSNKDNQNKVIGILQKMGY